MTIYEKLMLDNIVCLTKAYNGRNVNKSNEKYIFDRFGILCDLPNLPPYSFKRYAKPSESTKNLIELCQDRAKEMGTINLAWSGGIDSTFIASIYKGLDVDIKVVHIDVGRTVNAELLNYMRNNFNFETVSLGESYGDKLITGATSDILFDSEARRNGGNIVSRDGTSIKRDLPNPKYGGGIVWLDNYAETLGIKLETEEDILRLVVLCFKYYFYCYPKFVGENQESFFDTQEFTDYAFTNCWHRQGLLYTDPTYKKIQKDYIREIFGSDFNLTKTI